MIKRFFIEPKESFFLFGPRGTGKSTWLKTVFKPDVYIDLLRSENFLSLSNEPSQLRYQLLPQLKNKKFLKVVIDEIQKIPSLLDEVHSLIEDYPGQLKFALTGSSSRKLRTTGVNLLAGRALTRQFFPLTLNEYQEQISLDAALRFGTLPKVQSLITNAEKEDFLRSYSQSYLQEEIQQEALVRNLPNYIRFLKHLSLNNSKVINLSSISREAGISRAPLENYMSILIDTLMGTMIEPVHLRAKVKEVSNPKFYFFDCGVVEALSGNIGEPLSEDRFGSLFETLVLGELKAYSSYSGKLFDINYWGTPSTNEVDFILTKGKRAVGIEVKAAKKWRNEYTSGLKVLLEQKKIQKAIVIYRGREEELHGVIELLPFEIFCKRLFAGEIV